MRFIEWRLRLTHRTLRIGSTNPWRSIGTRTLPSRQPAHWYLREQRNLTAIPTPSSTDSDFRRKPGEIQMPLYEIDGNRPTLPEDGSCGLCHPPISSAMS